MNIKGVDLSEWQREVNFDQLKTAVDFCIIRSTYGTPGNGSTGLDKQFTRNQSEARRVGLLLGYYHYAYPQFNSATDEANWFLETVKPNEGEILVLDYEETWAGNMVVWCKTFLDTVSQKLNGYKPLIYLNLNQVTTHDWSSVIADNDGIWLADYDNSENPVATPWPVEAAKQYTDKAVISGVLGNVDEDVFFGDASTFKAYGYHAPAPAVNSTPDPNTPLVLSDAQTIQLGATLGVWAVGAIRSEILDRRRDLASAKTTIEDQQVEITKLQEQIDALQTINKTQVSDIQNAVNSVPKTGSSTTFTQITADPKNQPIHVLGNTPLPSLNVASFFSNLWKQIFG